MLSDVKRRAALAGVASDLRVEDLAIPKACPVLGIPLDAEKWSLAARNYATVDRIDNLGSYVRGNVEIMSWRANQLKRDGSLEELVMLGKWAAKKLREKRRAIQP